MATAVRRSNVPFAQLSPEEKMERRYPQPVRVGDLVGLPVLDYDDRTLGRVQEVYRTAAGKVRLMVPFGGWFGFGQRPVGLTLAKIAGSIKVQ